MLAHRIIPTILVRDGHLVKGTQFSADRIVGNALQAARIHAMRGVDEILILDVTATQEQREPDYEMIRKLTETARVPVTVGGGLHELKAVQQLLDAGADRVCIGTSFALIGDIAKYYGSQAVTVTLDIGEHEETATDAMMSAAYLRDLGAGEIILQSVLRDGTMSGYDLELINDVGAMVSIPVVASGGCSGYEDMYNAINAGADAVAAGALFQFTNATPAGAAEYLHERGVEVRI